jgi:predicted DNA-binding protein (UPF0251 family)
MLITMPRPCCLRRVGHHPGVTYFKPAGVPLRFLDETALALDELEALRLADLEGQHHEKAAGKMGISRATFGRIIEQARKKVAHALVTGTALRIGGGPVASPCAPCEKRGGCRRRSTKEAHEKKPKRAKTAKA